jgi:hypothetical protein
MADIVHGTERLPIGSAKGESEEEHIRVCLCSGKALLIRSHLAIIRAAANLGIPEGTP